MVMRVPASTVVPAAGVIAVIEGVAASLYTNAHAASPSLQVANRPLTRTSMPWGFDMGCRRKSPVIGFITRWSVATWVTEASIHTFVPAALLLVTSKWRSRMAAAT